MTAVDARRRRVAFVQTVPFELVGIQLLAAVLSEHELTVVITYIDGYPAIRRKLQAFQPDFICFTATTGDHQGLLAVARKLKEEFPVPFIWGGPHATFFPEIIHKPGVDVVVRGEGEEVLPRIIENPGDSTLASCSFKGPDGRVVVNPMGPLVRDLDALPFPDRSLYRRHYPSLPYSGLAVTCGRGCPFNCSFCYNGSLRKLYAEDCSAGRYVRLRSPVRVVEEIESHVARFGKPRLVRFFDDTLLFNRDWVLELFSLYEARVRLPFVCLGRADLVDEELVAAMKRAGIVCFMFAVESGSEHLRAEVLRKGISDAQIFACAALLKRHGVLFRTYNMIGLPHETVEDAFLTVGINRAIGNRLPLCNNYDPYPGTELAEEAERSGLLGRPPDSDSFGKLHYASSLLRVDPRLLRIQLLFFYFVRLPRLDRFLRRWIGRDHRLVNRLLFYPAYGYVFWRSYRYTLVEMARIIWRTSRPLIRLETNRP